MKRITEVEGLSPAAGPYSFAVISNGIVHTAGQIGQTTEGVLAEGGVEAEAHQAMHNLGRILGAVTIGFGSATKTTIYLTDVDDFARINSVYASYFPEGEYPARETIGIAALPLGARVEISMIATLDSQM